MKTLWLGALGALLLSTAALAQAQEIDGKAILRQLDDLYRGQSSVARTTMHIKTEHWERTLEMQAYSKGTERSLVRIVRPKQEEGTATLKVEDNIWNYLPKTRRVMKIPASMMMGSWMGSHFTNDDLVRESRLEGCAEPLCMLFRRPCVLQAKRSSEVLTNKLFCVGLWGVL